MAERLSGRASLWGTEIALVVLAMVVRLPFVLERVSPPEQADTVTYFGVADQLKAGNLFFQDVLTRAPGYSLFVVVADVLPGAREHNVVFVQHLLGLVLLVAVVAFAWRCFGAWTAWLAGLLMATAPLLFAIEDDALPDFLFGALVFAIVAALALLIVERPSRQRLWVVSIGVLIGVAALIKPVGQVLVLVPPIAFAAAGWPRRRLARDAALVVVACLVVLGPWLVHGLVRYGSPSLSSQGSLTLFNRVYEVDRRPIPLDTPDGRLVAAAIAARPDERPHAVAFDTLYRKNDRDSHETLAAIQDLAVEGVEDEPVGYVAKTFTGLKRFLTEARTHGGAGDPYVARAGPLGTAVPSAIWSLAAVLSGAWWIVTVFGLVGVAAVAIGPRERRLAATPLLAAWLLVALTTVASHGGLPRYSMQLAPITWLLSCAGLTAIVEALWIRVKPVLVDVRDGAGSREGAR